MIVHSCCSGYRFTESWANFWALLVLPWSRIVHVPKLIVGGLPAIVPQAKNGQTGPKTSRCLLAQDTRQIGTKYSKYSVYEIGYPGTGMMMVGEWDGNCDRGKT